MFLATVGVRAQEHRIAAREIVAEIQQHVGVEWKKVQREIEDEHD